MTKLTNSSENFTHGSHRCHGGTVSTASIAWVVANLLALSQPGTRVDAFTHSQKMCKGRNSQTKHVKRKVQPRCSSSLNYRNIESQPTVKGRFQQCHTEIFRESNLTNARMKTLVRGKMNDNHNISSETDHQIIVDEYLESIDRRYKRVHENDRSQRSFTSAWAWLAADEYSLKEEEKLRNEKDALYVLGLADLASVRLLQKHHLPVAQSQQSCNDSIILDIRGENRMSAILCTIPSIRPALAARSFARFMTSAKNAYNYKSIVLSLQLRALFYANLRRSGPTFTRFLAAFSVMSRYMTGGRLASQLAVLVGCVIVVARPFKA